MEGGEPHYPRMPVSRDAIVSHQTCYLWAAVIGCRAPRMLLQDTTFSEDRCHFFFMVSTTWVDLLCVAFLTVVNRPVFALRPTLYVFAFIFRAFTCALRVGGAFIAPPVRLAGVATL